MEQHPADLTELRALAEWLLTLDDPEDVLGREERRTVTLTQIIDRARAALGSADREHVVDGECWCDPLTVSVP